MNLSVQFLLIFISYIQGQQFPIQQNPITKNYYITLLIGSKEDQVDLFLDTRSQFTILPCSTCKTQSCFEEKVGFYNPFTSESLLDPCRDESCCSAPECKEKENQILQDQFVFLNQNDTVKEKQQISFQCKYVDNRNEYEDEPVARLGLGVETIAISNVPKNPIAEINSTYSICLGKGSGRLSIGEMQDSNFKMNYFVSLPYKIIEGEYYAQISGIQIQKQEINFAKFKETKKFIIKIDILTPYIFLESSIYEQFINYNLYARLFIQYFKQNFLAKEYLESRNLVCFDKYPTENYNDFFRVYPQIYFLIENQKLELMPKDYLVEEQKNLFCLAFKRSSQNHIILGSRFFYQREFMVDDINKQILLTRANCSSEIFGKGFDNSYIYKMGIYMIITICIIIGLVIIIVFFIVREYERRMNLPKSLKLKKKKNNLELKSEILAEDNNKVNKEQEAEPKLEIE